VLKPLRNPIAFILLTAAVLLWTFRVASLPPDLFKDAFRHAREGSPPIEFVEGDSHRPAYNFARWCMGKPKDPSFEAGLSINSLTTIVRDENGIRVYKPRLATADDEFLNLELLAIIIGKRRVDQYGLLAGSAVRYRTSVESHAIPYGSTITLTPAELDEALNKSLSPDAPRVISGVQTRWVLKPLAAAHDLTYAVTLLAWIYAILVIPRWKLQRRRAKNQCPTCAYDLAGLTTPTCPECGSTTNQPHTT